MVQSQYGQIYDLRVAGLEQAFHRCVHMCAVCRHRFDAGPTENAAGRTRMTRPDRLIVGIEHEAECLVEYAITTSVGNQNECFEEPRRVRTMPLGRAGIRHGLDRLVLSGEWICQSFGQTTDIPVVCR